MRLAMKRLNQTRRHRSGDPCDCAKCRGVLQVANTKVRAEAGVRVQYLACNECGDRPDDNKIVIPLEFAPERKRQG